MSNRVTLLFALALASLPEPTTAQQRRPSFGTHALAPGLVPSSIVARLPQEARRLEGRRLGLHRSVPLGEELVPHGRSGEYAVGGCIPSGSSSGGLPLTLRRKLEHPGRKKRPLHFEIHSCEGGLAIQSRCASIGKVGGLELAFVDLDHDGALGTHVDGYVVKPTRQRDWIDASGCMDLRKMTEPLEIEGERRWLEVDPAGFRLVLSDREPDRSLERAEDALASLALVNELRARLGHPSVVLDAQLSAACEEHARYCAAEGVLAHVQVRSKPFASEAGAQAGRNAELCFATSTREAVRLCNHTFYHRIAMLSPRLTHLGIGLDHGVAVIDTHSRRDQRDFEPFAWPPEGARDVEPSWITGEIPSPLGSAELSEAKARRFGAPISLSFPSTAVTRVRARLLCEGRELPAFVSSPEHPGNAAIPDNLASILVMARSPLPLGSTIRVEVQCKVSGKPFEKRWSFTTRDR